MAVRCKREKGTGAHPNPLLLFKFVRLCALLLRDVGFVLVLVVRASFSFVISIGD